MSCDARSGGCGFVQVSSASLPSAPAPAPEASAAAAPEGNVTLIYQPPSDLSVGGYPMGTPSAPAAPVQAPAAGPATSVAAAAPTSVQAAASAPVQAPAPAPTRAATAPAIGTVRIPLTTFSLFTWIPCQGHRMLLCEIQNHFTCVCL